MIASATTTTLCLLSVALHLPEAQAMALPSQPSIPSSPAASPLPRYVTADDIGNLGTEASWQIYMPEAAYRADRWNEQEARRLGRKDDLAALQAINATYAIVPNDSHNDGRSKKGPEFVHRRNGAHPLTAEQTAKLNESLRASREAPRTFTSEEIRTLMGSPELPDAEAAALIRLWNELETARCTPNNSAAPSTPSSPQS